MPRRVLPTLVLAFLLTSWGVPAAACIRILQDSALRPGETREQAFNRLDRERQEQLFRDTPSIFIADLVQLRTKFRNGGPLAEATVVPIQTIKGVPPAKSVRYDVENYSCGDWDYPSFSDTGVFFADASGSVLGMISIYALEDTSLRDRLIEESEAQDRLTQEQVAQALNQPRSLSWPWLMGASLISLLIGFLIGRGRPARTRTSKLS